MTSLNLFYVRKFKKVAKFSRRKEERACYFSANPWAAAREAIDGRNGAPNLNNDQSRVHTKNE